MSEALTVLDQTGAPVPNGVVEWDAWLRDQGLDAGFRQSSTWAEINREINRDSNYAIVVKCGGRISAGAMMSHRTPSRDNNGPLDRLKLSLTGAARGSLDCRDGPVVPGAPREELLAELLRDVEALADRLGTTQVNFHGFPSAGSLIQEPACDPVFARFGYRFDPWMTSLIDLSREEGELFRACHHAARKGVRKCERSGVTVCHSQGEDEFLRDFLGAVNAVKWNGRMDAAELQRRCALWRFGAERHYHFFVARDSDGAVLGILGTYAFNGTVTETASVVTGAGYASGLPAQDLLHWQAIRAHRAAGDRVFDLAGYHPRPRSAKEQGIRRFKEKWGGKPVTIPRYFRAHLSVSAKLVRQTTRLLRA